MKTDWTKLEPFRLIAGRYASSAGDTFGLFIFQYGSKQIRAIACDGTETGWEHVSVSVAFRDGSKTKTRMPTWDEMCDVKKRFW